MVVDEGREVKFFISPSAYSVPAIYPIDSPNSATRDLTGLDLEGDTVTLRVTLHQNSGPHFPLTRVSKTITVYPFYPQTLILFSELHMPNPPRSMPIPGYPDRGFHNPISDLLIPLLHSRPCIVPHSYKSESPMYCRPSLNID